MAARIATTNRPLVRIARFSFRWFATACESTGVAPFKLPQITPGSTKLNAGLADMLSQLFEM
ncbi:MAG TPA: hypothetical protein VGI13_07495, partial [Candidatus Acidoferrum sp.]